MKWETGKKLRIESKSAMAVVYKTSLRLPNKLAKKLCEDDTLWAEILVDKNDKSLGVKFTNSPSADAWKMNTQNHCLTIRSMIVRYDLPIGGLYRAEYSRADDMYIFTLQGVKGKING